METSKNLINPIDRLFINGFKTGDRELISRFFYGELAGHISTLRFKLFKNNVSYDEIVSELYLYLSHDNWARLDGFTGRNGCRLRNWMMPVAFHYLLSCRRSLSISGTPDNADDGLQEAIRETWAQSMKTQISIDITNVLSRMKNKRQAEAIRLLIIEGYSQEEVADMWGMRRSNVANIKHRAVKAFLKLYGERN